MNKNVFIDLFRWPTVHLNSLSNNFMNIQQLHFIDDLKSEVCNIQLSSYLTSMLIFLH